MKPQFTQVLLMIKDTQAAAKFYNEGLGITIKEISNGMAELDADGTTIVLHHAENPNPGSSPILSFRVEDIYGIVEKLEGMGAKLEGRIREPFFGKVAAVRTPDGHLISLVQPTEPVTSSENQ